MWPGDQQSGGEQYPQGTPPHQPQQPQTPPPPPQPPAQGGSQGGYGQPANPYAQPGYPQQPGYPTPQPQQPQPQTPPPAQPGYQQPPPYGQPANPYAQPPGYQQPPGQPPAAGYPTPQAWGPPVPGGPDGGPPQKDNRKLTIGIAIAAAIAVVAAVTVGAVYFTGNHDKKDDAKDSPTPTATSKSPAPATTDPGDSGGDDTDNPRGGDTVDIKPVIPGWKVVRHAERNAVFDVPPGWTVDNEGVTIGFTDDKGKIETAMSAPAYYKHKWCTSSDGTADRAAVGTKGGAGATSLKDAADTQAVSWAYSAYQTKGKGTFSKAKDSKAFKDAYGITGWQAEATASNLPKGNKCTPPGGTAYTVAWLDPSKATPTPVIWVLYADTGVPDQLAQSVIDKIKSTIRPINAK